MIAIESSRNFSFKYILRGNFNPYSISGRFVADRILCGNNHLFVLVDSLDQCSRVRTGQLPNGTWERTISPDFQLSQLSLNPHVT